MARTAFEKVIDLAVANAKPPEIQRRHAAIARKGLADHVGRLQHKPAVVTLVDGRRGAAEETVQAYGVIRYEFQRQREIAAYALRRCRELSPERSGRYRDSWFVMSAGRQVNEADMPEGQELVIVNDQPYHRKIIVGAQRNIVQVPPGIIETVRQELFQQFGYVVNAEIRYIHLQGGYILKGRRQRKRSAQNNMSSAFRAGQEFISGRKDTAAGQPMTYPALIIKPL